ncbi:MAG: TRAM domain-containing protein, partial [Synergistaceae bacterium]
MQQGETIKATVSALNNEGEGVIRCGNEHFVLFVPNALPGEEILCRAVKVKKNYGIGKVLERYSDSPDRTEPLCAHFGRCGGCQLQHLSYTAQVRLKQQTVIDALARIGGIENPIVDECVPSPKEWGYRNKASLPVQSENTFISGFYKTRSHDIVPFNECPVLMPELEHYIKSLLAELASLAKDSKNDKNNIIKFIRHIVF